jgi:hypothetical protein
MGRNVPQSRRVPRPRQSPRDGSGTMAIAAVPVARGQMETPAEREGT